MIPQLSPIKLPPLKKLWMSDKNSCRSECWQAMLMIFTSGDLPTGQTFWIDEEQTIWIWEAEQDRLWLLGHSHSSVNYFSFETGHPFLWKSESLLKKSRTDSFDYSAVSFHLSIGVDYWMPPSNDVLPDECGVPKLFLEMEKKLPAWSRKFIRQYFTQLTFKPFGFQAPTLERTELLSLLIQTTCETTIATVQKLHTEIWKLVCVDGEVKSSEEKSIETEDSNEEDGILVNENQFELIKVGSPVSKIDPHGIFEKPESQIWPPANIYHETPKEAEATVSQESQAKS